MTDKQIASIAQYWDNLAQESQQSKDSRRAVIETAHEDIAALLSERAAMREIVQDVAGGFTLYFDEMRSAYVCVFCDAEAASPLTTVDEDEDTVGWHERHIQHTTDCLVTKSRTQLKEMEA
ncbi:MAG: hypothetical protein ACXWQR_21200 [Ktedonobacterales bacterium]